MRLADRGAFLVLLYGISRIFLHQVRGVRPARRPPAEEQFHLEEYKALRREIQSRNEQQSATERSVILAIAAIYSFLATILRDASFYQQIRPVLWLVWWVPVALSGVGLLRWLNDHMMIGRIAEYIRIYESQTSWGIQGLDGWERHIESRRNRGFIHNDRLITLVLWVLLIFFTAVIAVFKRFHWFE